MRFFGHPVHVMLVHFPIALWPAHWGFHLLSHRLPEGLAGGAGFWLLLGGVVLGWLAAGAGFLDLIVSDQADKNFSLAGAWRHGVVNGSVLLGFTILLGLERSTYPVVTHGPVFLVIEGVFLVLLGLGNYLGGLLVWTVSGHRKN